jgi:hypothetical protein
VGASYVDKGVGWEQNSPTVLPEFVLEALFRSRCAGPLNILDAPVFAALRVRTGSTVVAAALAASAVRTMDQPKEAASMKIMLISRFVVLPVALCTMSVAPLMVRAQDDGTTGPPKVLVIQREMMKPGRAGSMHEKSEGAFVAALKANHLDIHYLAMTSLSGPNRALFFSGYSSVAAWGDESKALDKNVAGAAALDRANVVDGDLLAEQAQSMWLRDDELSMNPHDLKGDRYMQISQYFVKPGHVAEWEELVKLVKEGYAKGVPEASWVVYEQRYGPSGSAYIVLTPLKSLSEVDGMLGSGKSFMDAMGESGMKKMGQLEAASVETWQMNLFAFSPKMSSPPEQWVKDEPDYWGPKKMMAPMKKAEMKPMP